MGSHVPSILPSDLPSVLPSNIPSDLPSVLPSDVPSDVPSFVPSEAPSDSPSFVPSDVPSLVPSTFCMFLDVNITTDASSDDTSWKISDAFDNTIIDSPGYSQTFTNHFHTYCVNLQDLSIGVLNSVQAKKSAKFKFTINDKSCNGIDCENTGSLTQTCYQVHARSEDVKLLLAEGGGDFGCNNTHEFTSTRLTYAPTSGP